MVSTIKIVPHDSTKFWLIIPLLKERTFYWLCHADEPFGYPEFWHPHQIPGGGGERICAILQLSHNSLALEAQNFGEYYRHPGLNIFVLSPWQVTVQ